MKRVLRLTTAIMVLTTASVFSSNAQVSVNINIGAQPLWGPVGYERVEYYYLPDVEAYYYVPRHQFVYLSGGSWVFSAYLPGRYRNYDLYSGYKVVINEPRPYLHYRTHHAQYARYCGYRDRQVAIRDCRDSRYYVVEGHPYYRGGNGYGNGRGYGHGHGHGHGRGRH